MIDVQQTESFAAWFSKLKDQQGRKAIGRRIALLEDGHWGDVKSVGGKVLEMRVHAGPGYRVYLMRVGHEVVVLLAGGDKGSQARDIEKARLLAAQFDN